MTDLCIFCWLGIDSSKESFGINFYRMLKKEYYYYNY